MANTFTNLNYTILSDTVFNSYIAAIAPLKSFSLNILPDQADRGQIVQALFVPTQDSAQSFDPTVGYTIQDSQAESVQVTLSEHEYVSIGLTDTEITNYPQLQLEKFGTQKGFQLGKSVFQSVTGSFVAGNGSGQYPNTFASSGTLNVAKVIQLGQQADELNWPENDRSMILPPAQYASLISDPNLLKALEYGSSEPIKEGVIPEALGWKFFKSNILPSNIQHGLAVRSDALAVAMRPLVIARSQEYYEVSTLTDPESGFVVTYRRWYSRQMGKDQAVWECVFGATQGLPEAAIIFTN